MLNDMNINSDDFSNSSTSTFINNQLDTEISNIIIEFYNEIDVIFTLYNRILEIPNTDFLPREAEMELEKHF